MQIILKIVQIKAVELLVVHCELCHEVDFDVLSHFR
jgi:hypothetical protein